MLQSQLRRFWFPVAGQLGIGVTAETLAAAVEMAREAAATVQRITRAEQAPAAVAD